MGNNNFLLKDIKLVVCDFDGIFTDGKIEVFSDGKTSKKLDYKDIMGIAIVVKRGIKFAIISGENSAAIDIMKEKFPMIDTFQNERNKINILKSLADKYNINPQNIIYMGDDINDIDCLNYVRYPISVPNAHAKVKGVEGIYITKNNGGYGAFREIADLILWENFLHKY